MALIITIIDFVIVIFSMLFLAPIGILCGFLSIFGLKKQMAHLIYKIVQFWAKLLIFCTGCHLNVKGRENIPKTGPLCFVSNHTGIFDILLLLALVGRPVGFIAKKELAYIPFLNLWIFLLGGFFIDRKNIRKAIKTINKGIERIKNGEAMIIFPEGTRSKGKGLLPFRGGSFKLATQSNACITPVAISGSYEVFEKSYRVKAVNVNITFAPSIETANLSTEEKKKNLSDQVHRVIDKALEDHTSLDSL